MRPLLSLTLLTALSTVVAHAGGPTDGGETSSPSARSGPEGFRWYVPGGFEEVDIPGLQTSMGIPTKLRAVRSRWRVEELYRHFREAFLKAGLYLPPEVKLPINNANLTAYDPNREISYTVILQQNPDKTVTCILGEGYVGQRKSVSAFAPLHPKAEGVLQSSSEGMRMVAYEARVAPAELEAFYRDGLLKQGFKELEPLTFQRARTTWKVQLARDGEVTRVVVIDSPQLAPTILRPVE